MIYTTFAATEEDLQECALAPGIGEVLLEPTALARQGTLSREDCRRLAVRAREMGLRPALVWDTLINEDRFISIQKELVTWELNLFDSIRVRDLGAAQYIFKQHEEIELQLLVEVGNHNYEALVAWCEYFGKRLKRLILSIELPEATLLKYVRILPVECEVLGAGPISMFYTPRLLVSDGTEQNRNAMKKILASSPESHNRSFPVVESQHGTQMFLDKNQFILDKLHRLKDAGLFAARVDLRHLSDGASAAQGIEEFCTTLQVDSSVARASWKCATLSPFFKTNKTTAQFGRLKPRLDKARDDSCLAVVLESKPGEYAVLWTLQEFTPGGDKTVMLPSGKEIELSSLRCSDLSGKVLDRCAENRLVLVQGLSRVTSGALLRAEPARFT